jgi:hypothetical protein
MKSPALIASCAGLLAIFGLGFGARRLLTAEGAVGGNAAATAPASGRADGGPSRKSDAAERAAAEGQVRALMAATAATRSGDSLESILRIDPVAEYGRLALWMVDASAEEIGDYWDHYRAQPNRDNDVNDLIFINWTRVDPEAAVARSAGTSDEHYAWWAWACHDPATALAQAKARNPGRVNNVTWALGEFHPEWARKHFDQIPEPFRDNVFHGMVKWDDAADPALILDFLSEQNRGTDARMLKALVRKDPWAAYDRAMEDGDGASRDPFGNNPMDLFVSTMAEFHPDLLERMAQLTPAGELKWKMETAAFDSLLKMDPAKAIQMAKDNKAPVIAAQWLEKAGISLLSSDPDGAFELAGRIFDLPRAAWTEEVRIDFADGSSTRGGAGAGGDLLAGLVAQDPQRTMDLALSSGETAVNMAAVAWAGRDLYGFSEWVSDQPPSDVRSDVVGVLVNRLSNEGMHAEAVSWSASDARQRQRLYSTFQIWHSSDPQAASAWAATADLTDAERTRIEQTIRK